MTGHVPKYSFALLVATLAAGVAATPASALNIVLNADSSFSSQPNGAAALAGFRTAANYWNTTLNNNVTLNFNVSYRALGTGILGSTGSNGCADERCLCRSHGEQGHGAR